MHCKIRPFWDRVDALKILDQAALWMAQAFLRSARHLMFSCRAFDVDFGLGRKNQVDSQLDTLLFQPIGSLAKSYLECLSPRGQRTTRPEFVGAPS
jgi:hypothetical protein